MGKKTGSKVDKAPKVPKENPLRLILLGDPGVGKSSFLNASKGDAVENGPWSNDYMIKKYSVVRGSVWTEVQIYDPQDTTTMTMKLFGFDGVLVLFDLTKYESSLNARNWLNECEQYDPPVINKLLIGNKSDLESLRMVSESTAKYYALVHLGVHFIETSAITKANVEEAIQYLVTKIMDRRWPKTASAGQAVLYSSLATEGQPVPQLPSPRSISESGSAVDAQARPERMGIQLPPPSSNASSSLQPESLELPRKDVSSIPYINSNQGATKPEMVFKRVREVLNDSRRHEELLALQGDYAQAVLDLLQKVLDRQEVSDDLKNSVFTVIKQLSQKTGLYPKIPTFQGVRVEDEPITTGTFGDTWKASYGAYPICLKVIHVHPSVASTEHLVAECVKETLTFSHFEHLNILPFYGIFRMEDSIGWIGMVTPWMPNGTIHEYLDLNPEAPRLPLVYDMLEGLGYLHAQSVIHGNLRAANVLITPTGAACIADYGLYPVITLANESEIWDSNLRWKAPELIDELQDGTFPSPTPSSDVYSAASVMYEILVGCMPFFELKHDNTVVSRVIRGIRPTKPSTRECLELSDEIWAIMIQSWRGNPDERLIVPQILESLRQIPPLPLTTMRLWKAMQKQRTDFRSPLTANAFRAAVLGDAPIFEHSLIRL